MATANLDPITAARMAKQEAVRAGLSSPDPIRRYQTREAYITDGLAAASAAMVQRAKQNRVTKSFIKGIGR